MFNNRVLFNNVNTNVSCFKCKKRTVTCHGTCEDYNNWRDENAKKASEARLLENIDYEREEMEKKFYDHKW